jgi:hypothetical protein
MRAAPNRDDADAVRLRRGDGFRHGPRRDHEAEAVLAVEQRRDRRDALRLEVRAGVDEPAPEPV